jgi:hypothetical protein
MIFCVRGVSWDYTRQAATALPCEHGVDRRVSLKGVTGSNFQVGVREKCRAKALTQLQREVMAIRDEIRYNQR